MLHLQCGLKKRHVPRHGRGRPEPNAWGIENPVISWKNSVFLRKSTNIGYNEVIIGCFHGRDVTIWNPVSASISAGERGLKGETLWFSVELKNVTDWSSRLSSFSRAHGHATVSPFLPRKRANGPKGWSIGVDTIEGKENKFFVRLEENKDWTLLLNIRRRGTNLVVFGLWARGERCRKPAKSSQTQGKLRQVRTYCWFLLEIVCVIKMGEFPWLSFRVRKLTGAM